MGLPAEEEPFGHGDGEVGLGPGGGERGEAAENGVGEAGGGGFAGAFDEFDAFGDGGVGRDAVEEAELEGAHAEGAEDGGVDGVAVAGGGLGDEVVELGEAAEDAEDDLGGEAGVAGVEAGGAFVEQGAGLAAALNRAEDFEGDAACGSQILLCGIMEAWNYRRAFCAKWARR